MRSTRFSTRITLSALMAGLVSVLSASTASAQHSFSGHGADTAIHGVPPSVTSFGFGGHAGFHGTPPSVTSLGFGRSGFRIHQRPFGFRRRHTGFVSPFYGGYLYPYGFPYDFDDYYTEDPGVDDAMEQQYTTPGPTIFDSHGVVGGYATPAPPPYNEDYRRGMNSRPTQEQAPPEPAAEQPSTLLVFKDGHQVEVENYAIVGATLYDLSGGRTKKVALAELDLSATVKQNDDRGVDFKLPDGMKLN